MASPPPPSTSASPDAVLHLAGLHALAAAGFASTSRAASMTLSSAVAQYLRLVASTCMERASLAGRNKVAAVDVVAALDDLGMQVGDLYDWVGDQQEASLTGGNLGGLEAYLRDGLAVQDPIAELKMVPEDDMVSEIEEEDEQDEQVPKDEPIDEDAVMQDDVVIKDEATDQQEEGIDSKFGPFAIRHQSPDLSWLPPLPTSTTALRSQPVHTTDNATTSPTIATTATLAAAPDVIQSIADRYRKPIPYASSQLAQTHPFADPPHPAQPPILPPAPSSLPNLISTYAATASEPSIALRQTDLRRQATDLLRLSIATVDSYSPADTLTAPIPPVRSTPIVPSHSDVLPQRFLPLNPRPTGLLSSLVQQMHSPYLPPALRERLTSLRPPIAQMRDNQPILYGDPVRGPDDAALAKSKGKHHDVEAESITSGEVWLSQTWDSGPRGMEKWSRGKLPTGRKVVQSKEGENVPREPEGSKMKEESQKQPLKLRLPSAGSGGLVSALSPGSAPVLDGTEERQTDSVIIVDQSSSPSNEALLPTQSIASTPTVPSLKFKFGAVKKEPGIPTPTIDTEQQSDRIQVLGSAADPAAATIMRNGTYTA